MNVSFSANSLSVSNSRNRLISFRETEQGDKKSSEEWKTSTKSEALSIMEGELASLLNTSPDAKLDHYKMELSGFRNLFARFLRAKPTVDWSKIEPLPEGAIRPYKSLGTVSAKDIIAAQLRKLVVVKLNGGLGTSMGCKGPNNFQTLNKTYGVDVPLVLMNSFNTNEDTSKVLKKYSNVKVSVHTFSQSQYPRINRETLLPIVKSLDGDDNECWYPPGHGNFYEAFHNSGLLDKFIADGKEYCFLSNIDNMGATVDLSILNFVLNPQAEQEAPEFLMEVTDKTRADVKGGTLIQYEGRLMLLEIAQVPKDYVDEFKSISKFRIFNTNNLWAKLSAMKRVVTENKLEMEVIVNPKHLDRGLDVIQLETAAGAAIKSFRGAVGVNVPRSRFLPVKKTSDLLLLMSNLYDIDNGSLTLSHQRSFPTTPLVKLGSSFDKVKDYLGRFNGIPDLLELDHLTVSGDVWFGKDVSLKGTVIIIANHGDRIDIPPGSILENKIVSGNLRILEH
ncbi:Protein CBG18265 [Caenorhabditis briggsae]|uniref:UTP--glucose-1-phosphate uridylyltransferase n=1 Tax=Caenorhabditis briggsae TaxID=6238 RepID=A8XSA3_CAEBR|nr:Protein CBG18265 [Caenorhabditis briggsae]CAP35745.2 Protein CBG18265 [Caenorhabditis briggsae]